MAVYNMVIGSYTFQYNPQSITDKTRINNKRKTPLTGNISFIQRLGVTRDISIKGMLKATSETDEAELDNFRAAALASGAIALYSRSDRIYRIYPTDVTAGRALGSQHKRTYTLSAMMAEPYIQSATQHTSQLTVTASGDTKVITNAGTAIVEPEIQIVCDTASLVNPVISDGTNTLTVTGTMAKDDSLVISRNWEALLNGTTDWSGKLSGAYPVLAASANTTITYTDGATSSHQATLSIVFRDWFW